MIFYCQKTYQGNEGNKSFRQKNINSGGLWYFSRILLDILTSQLQRGQSLSGSFVSSTDINISLFKDEPDSDTCSRSLACPLYCLLGTNDGCVIFDRMIEKS